MAFVDASEGKEIPIKVGMVGDTETGKTSLMVKYCENKFDEDYIMTIGVSYKEKVIPLGENKIILNVWDLGGQGDNVHMLPLVANDADALLFMFDLNRKQTLIGVKEWYKQARQFNANAPVFLVGTKFDLFAQTDQENLQTMTKLAKKFAKAMKAPLIFVSSKAAINVNKLFKVILGRLLETDVGVEELTAVGEPILMYKDKYENATKEADD